MQRGAVAGKAPSCSASLFDAEAPRAGMPGCSQDAQNVLPTPSAAQRELAPGCVLFEFVRGKLGAGRVADSRGPGCSMLEATWARARHLCC